MLNLKLILNNPEAIKTSLSSRGFDVSIIDEVVKLGKNRSSFMTSLQQQEAKRNSLSKEVGIKKSSGQNADNTMQELSALKKEIESIKAKEQKVNDEINHLLLNIPNTPLPDIPLGKDESENVVIKEHLLGRGKINNIKPHFEIGIEKNIVDFERAVKLSGARFWSYVGLGAKLVRALEHFMLEENIKRGYLEIKPPLLVKSNILEGTGQLPKFGEDLFKLADKDLYLIPTAEVPLTNFYREEILDLSQPIALTAYTPCFRSESGSGGKDMKGLIRAHQFNKVEIVKIVSMEKINEEFNKSLDDAKNILEKLELPFQELMLCTGDIGFTSQKTVDLEVWIPSENRYRETSSVSIFGDFQTRRASIRYRHEGKNKYAGTINGSALAIDRVMAAILENYQNEDGSITIPKVLVPYMGVDIIK